ncbi:MAG: DUF4199 domain-containing protein [Cyclobacteriaceae bacterium]|nr:DUF4199 domain-containing protein [Cyclobacteriaceae bacterium]
MKKIVIIYGLIAGIIVGATFFIGAPLFDQGIITFDNGMWVGYTSMIIALSLIFFGVKNYRDNKLQGIISFGTAFKMGLLITGVASVVYALSWEVAYRTVSKGYSEAMYTHELSKIKENSKNETELQEQTQRMEDFKVMYENPLIRFGITLMEIFPVGLLISLIVAGLLRKKEFLPPSQATH